MIFILGLIIAGIIVMIMMKRAGRKMIRSRGTVPVRICEDCGHPRGKCQHLRRQAERAAGFRGSLRKK